MNSLFLKLNRSDFAKGLILAVITAVLGALYQLLQTKGFALTGIDLQELLKIALTAFVGYLSKNLLTNSSGEFGKAE
jgi:hypothetical protein